jgi:flagellin-like hook-associated protein FlgL
LHVGAAFKLRFTDQGAALANRLYYRKTEITEPMDKMKHPGQDRNLVVVGAGTMGVDITAAFLAGAFRLNRPRSGHRGSSRVSAFEVLDYLDEAMSEVDRFRGQLGANLSRLSNIIDNLQTTTFNRELSKSQIMDADYARESTDLIKSQLLQQASTATLAQANASQTFVLEMLRS